MLVARPKQLLRGVKGESGYQPRGTVLERSRKYDPRSLMEYPGLAPEITTTRQHGLKT